MHFPNVLLQYTLGHVRMMDNATHLMAWEPVTVQLMHKTPSLWTRAGVPWILGHDPNLVKFFFLKIQKVFVFTRFQNLVKTNFFFY